MTNADAAKPLPAPLPEPGPPIRAAGTRVAAWRLLLHSPIAVGSAVVLVLFLLVALVAAPAVAPLVNHTDVLHALQGPSPAHWFGTDDLGRDLLVRTVAAAQVSLIVAVVSVGFALVVGGVAGVLAGYLGGWVDMALMRLADVMFAFPVLLLALAIVAVLQPGMLTTILAIGIVYTPIFARVARASTLAIRVEPYVEVSRTMGTPTWAILVRHILPGIAGPVLVQTSLSLAFAILSEAALSFLGLGIQPPQPSWGGMLFTAQGFLGIAWWMSVFPGAAIFLAVLAFNLLGDGLRDVLDPRQRSLLEARSRG